MKCAVLCNGPSKVLYKDNSDYDYVIGCNIPWTRVHATVLLDKEVVRLWDKDPTLINVPAYFSVDAWRETDGIKNREFFIPFLLELVEYKIEYFSSGHVAVTKAIEKGYTGIDIYGCDSYFEFNIVSYTHKFIKNANADDSYKHVVNWRNNWNMIINNNPEVKINFIR